MGHVDRVELDAAHLLDVVEHTLFALQLSRWQKEVMCQNEAAGVSLVNQD